MYLTTWQLVVQASVVVKLILLILSGFSVVSWALILYKYLVLADAARQSAAFQAAVESGGDARQLLETAKALSSSPAARVCQAVYETRETVLTREQRVNNAVAAETERLHAYLTFLATTGSATPFIGLLGTVWGIMDAFRGIGAAGSASLAVVSPAIAEALVTTAAGLLAAIPAVIAYNAFLHWSGKLVRDVEAFADHLQVRGRED